MSLRYTQKEKELEKTLKAIANRRRMRITHFLSKKKKATVGDIALHLSLSVRSTSRHLAVLRSAGIVENQQVSKFVFYLIHTPKHPCVQSALYEM